MIRAFFKYGAELAVCGLFVLGITFLIQSQPNKAIVFLPAK